MIDTIQADVMLLGWSETHNGGAKITLQLADIAQLEPFKRMTLKKGKIAGQLMTAVFVEVDGNGEPVAPEPEAPAAKKRGGGKFPLGYCGLAVMWSGDPVFIDFLVENFPQTHASCLDALGPGTHPIDLVGGWCLKKLCGISSRKELDTNDRARALFEMSVRWPYTAFRKERGLE